MPVLIAGDDAAMSANPLPIGAAWRLGRVAAHLAGGCLTVLCLYPLVPRRARLALKRRWSRQLLVMLDVRVEVVGDPAAAMRVANHVSWLDIFVINAVAPSAFVAKDDVRGWPVIGWLCARTETLFIRRGSRRAALESARDLAARIAAGVEVAAFPEGTTSDGRAVLPFHSALLQGAIDAGAVVQPLALRYRDAAGDIADAPVYVGDTSLGESLRRIAAAGGLSARLEFLPGACARGADRRELAAALRADIAAVLARPAAPVAAAACRPEPPAAEIRAPLPRGAGGG